MSDIYDKFDGRCGYCGCDLNPNLYVLSKVNPLDADSLIVPACDICTSEKGKKNSIDFKNYIIKKAEEFGKRRDVIHMVRFGLISTNIKYKTFFSFYYEMKGNHV